MDSKYISKNNHFIRCTGCKHCHRIFKTGDVECDNPIVSWYESKQYDNLYIETYQCPPVEKTISCEYFTPKDVSMTCPVEEERSCGYKYVFTGNVTCPECEDEEYYFLRFDELQEEQTYTCPVCGCNMIFIPEV